MQDDINNNDLKPPSNDGCRDDVIPSEDSEFHAFTRASARKSLTNNAAMMRWLEAQERLIERNADVSHFTSSVENNLKRNLKNVLVRIRPPKLLTYC